MRHNKDGVFVNTGLLRDHVYKLRERKKTATRLYEKVAGMRRLDDPTVSYRYNSILREIEQLIEYFDRMAVLLDNVESDAVELSQNIRDLMQEGIEETHRKTSENFML